MAADPRPQVFFGEFHHTLDDKNRITIPARWRNGSEDVFLVPHPSGTCLVGMPAEVFRKFGDEAGKHASVTPDHHRTFVRQFFARAQLCPIDRQGRLLIPEEHCRRVGLSGEVVLVGGHDRFEAWSPAAWKKTNAAAKATYEKVAGLVGL